MAGAYEPILDDPLELAHCTVGSRHCDLQMGWLASTRTDPIERPVFLDGRREGEAGNCALYTDGADGTSVVYLAENFKADPYLFLSIGDWVVQHVLIINAAFGDRFYSLEKPESMLTDFLDTNLKANTA
jgi:hypothetical protein